MQKYVPILTFTAIILFAFAVINILFALSILNEKIQKLSDRLNNTMDQYVLCATPITSNITSYSSLSFKEI